MLNLVQFANQRGDARAPQLLAGPPAEAIGAIRARSDHLIQTRNRLLAWGRPIHHAPFGSMCLCQVHAHCALPLEKRVRKKFEPCTKPRLPIGAQRADFNESGEWRAGYMDERRKGQMCHGLSGKCLPRMLNSRGRSVALVLSACDKHRMALLRMDTPLAPGVGALESAGS